MTDHDDQLGVRLAANPTDRTRQAHPAEYETCATRDKDDWARAYSTRNRIAEMFSMRALEYLVAIVEQGSLTQAAAVLHISQPASAAVSASPARKR